MKKLVSACVIIILSLSLHAAAETITFVTGANSPPYTYVENEKIVGLNIDIVTEACKRLGSEAEIRREPWKRSLRSMEQGEADGIISPTYTEERNKFLCYPSESLGTSIKVIIITPKGSNIKITGLDDIKDENIGVVTDYSYGSEFDHYQGLKKISCYDEDQLFRMLNLGRMNIAVTREIPFRYITKNLGLRDRFEIAYVLNDNQLYVAFSRARGKKVYLWLKNSVIHSA